MDYDEYRRFIASKGSMAQSAGFAPENLPNRLFNHQRSASEFALETGRSALFLDTGLGKSGCEAVFAYQCAAHTGKPSLILTPLAVGRQMQRECAAFDVDAAVIREPEDVRPGVNILNYERLSKFDPSVFGSVVLDESSILKSFNGTTMRALVDMFKDTPFRLAATATPAPNDHIELGNHAEFLGLMKSQEMLARWFINDTSTASHEWRLKGHAEQDFWGWVASWARAASLPSDLGGDDTGYVLAPIKYHIHTIRVDLTPDDQGMLFRIPDNSATSIHAEKKKTMADRVAYASEVANNAAGSVIVWCERDDESAALTKAIPDAIEVKGSMTPDQKEAALDAFSVGNRRVIVTKPKLAGFGLNWQHARTQVFASLSHSYEQFYQAIRRSWRYGQSGEVHVHVVVAETEQAIWRNIRRKSDDHDRLKLAMAKAMIAASSVASAKTKYTRTTTVTLPDFLRG